LNGEEAVFTATVSYDTRDMYGTVTGCCTITLHPAQSAK